MRKSFVLLLAVIALSGCTTYKFQKGLKPYDQGYVVSRRGFVIAEYTIGENSTVPAALELAQERFSRRKKSVEYYYEKLGDIDSNFKSYFLKPLSTAGGLVTSPVRLPMAAYQDYKYEHNSAYKEKMDKIDDQADQKQRDRVKIIRDYLSKYIQDDLAFERELLAAKGKTEARELAQQPSKQEELPMEAAVEVKSAEIAVEEKPAEVSAEAKPAEAVVEEKPTEVTPPVEATHLEEAAQASAEKPESVPVVEVAKTEAPVVEAPVKEEKMDEELAKQEVKPKKTGLWQKTKNFFKRSPKPAKPQEEAQETQMKEEKPPKESFWKKMFKPKEKTVKLTERIPGEPPVAIITAKPMKGYSPLKVRFSAGKSHAIKGKIVSYEWDFSDGDKAKKLDPINTFYSGSFEPKQFTVTLTVQDDKGNIGTATETIEVLNK
ncbi:MAG: PKD domain-containing protein [Candidatus Omnitrophica bacterium]|nr:PKD domain-containing protein [Candidatus Omnitrophota bacterium]